METIELFVAWLGRQLSWLGFVTMAVLGSVVAHIKAYEQAQTAWTVSQHAWGLVRRFVYGATAGMMVYYLHLEYKWSGPLSFVVTGIASIFAADFFDFLWVTGKAWVRKKIGIEGQNDEK